MNTTPAPPAAPVTVVTGANSGIGRATAISLAAAGHTVVATARSVSKCRKLLQQADAAEVNVEVVELDISSDASVAAGFEHVLELTGRIDNLVNNAGVGGNGVVEEISSGRFLDVFNVDLCGAVRCTQQVLPGMRERGSGTVVNVSSVSGRVASIGQAPYVAAKWALEGISEELAVELAPFGIRVRIVEPGFTKSAIFAKNTDVKNQTGVYEAHYERMLQLHAAGYRSASEASDVAMIIQQAIESDTEQLRYQVSWGGPELVLGRSLMSDEEWVAIGRAHDLDEYIAAFRDRFHLDIAV